MVVAAGNNNANTLNFMPANCTGGGLIVVGASDSAARKAAFSNYGIHVDVSAPGVGIVSTLNAGTTVPGADSYVYYNGSSMAAPHVAGLVAMMRSKPSPDCTPGVCEAIIKANTKPFAPPPPPPPTLSGTGIINALQTLNATP